MWLLPPDGYKPNPVIVAQAQADANANGGRVTVVTSPQEAIKDADVVYTDVWASMGQEENWRSGQGLPGLSGK